MDLVSAAGLFFEQDDGGALIRSFRDNFNCPSSTKSSEADAGSFPDKAGEAGQSLGAPHGLNVFVEDGLGGRCQGRLYENIVGLIRRHAVYRAHHGSGQRLVTIAVAGPAGHHLASAKVCPVDGGDHVDHVARHPLPRSIRRPIDFVGAGADVTIRAIELKGRRHESHCLHEIVDRDSLEGLDVFENLVRHQRLLL